MLVWLLALATAADPPWSTLFDDAGWAQASTPSTTATGRIDLRTKVIEGTTCLRGEARVGPKPAALIALAADIDAAPSFSSEKLLISEVVAKKGTTSQYVQAVDLPGWTMAADRYWVLQGEARVDGPSHVFRWQQFDWRTEHPDLATRLAAELPGAVEPTTNWGAWAATRIGDETLLRYHLCTVPGGNVPAWLQKTAATKTLPAAMAALVSEAVRREAAEE